MTNADTLRINYPGLTRKQKARISFHAILVIIIGSTAGFAWLISLAGYLQLWPLPPMEIPIPDEKELWRNAHLGPIMHGMLMMIIVAVSSLLTLTKKESRILVLAAIIEMWGNAFGFQSAPFTSNRGLSPTGSFINVFSYGTFYVAVFAAFVVLIIAAIGCYRTLKSSE